MTTRLALAEQNIANMPGHKDLQAVKDFGEGKTNLLRQQLEAFIREENRNRDAAAKTDRSLEGQALKKEILAEIKALMEERSQANQRFWTRFGIVVSALPILIIIYFVATGMMTPAEGAAAAAGAM
ncbi:MAG: hypothetical protein AAGJ50_01535 [Pseudomonadota bacterium]